MNNKARKKANFLKLKFSIISAVLFEYLDIFVMKRKTKNRAFPGQILNVCFENSTNLFHEVCKTDNNRVNFGVLYV